MSNPPSSEPQELLAFRARLRGISMAAPTITGLGAMMRAVKHDSGLQERFLQVWLSDVETSANDPSSAQRLLALVYVANDVIQLLRQDEEELRYRYRFAYPFAKAVSLCTKVGGVAAKVQRVVKILKDRMVYDSLILGLLSRLSTIENEVSRGGDVDAAALLLLTEINTQAGTNFLARKQELDRELSAATTANATTSPPPTSAAIPTTRSIVPTAAPQVVVQISTVEDYLAAGRNLRKLWLPPRTPSAVNFDVRTVSYHSGHRLLATARISAIDSGLITRFKAALEEDKAARAAITEKSKRRKAEAEKSTFMLIANRPQTTTALTVARRVEVLLKKELNQRLDKAETDHKLFWCLHDLLDHIARRWKRLQMVLDGVDKELVRRRSGRGGDHTNNISNNSNSSSNHNHLNNTHNKNSNELQGGVCSSHGGDGLFDNVADDVRSGGASQTNVTVIGD